MRARAALPILALLACTPGVLVPAAAHADQIRDMQWIHKNLQLNKTWKYSRGAGVTVAVLDTGVDPTHPDLKGKVITGPDYTGRSTPPDSRYWALHGTAMAGIIAGRGHGANRGDGVMGVAPGARILSLKVTWENKDPARNKKQFLEMNKDAMAKGIRHAVDNGAKVINMSLGGGKADYTGSETEQEAIDYAASKGVVVIASMGNDGADENRRNFPAAYDNVIAVGAVDKSFKHWKSSNHNPWISVAAPGVGIVTTQPDNAYATDDGTSASAAIVTGVAALIRARYPDLTPAQIKDALERGTTHRPASGRNDQVGSGVVHAWKALLAAHRIAESTDSVILSPAEQAATDPTAEPPPVPAKSAPDSARATAAEEARKEKEKKEEGFSGFVIIILAGGTVLVTAGLGLAWRSRRNSRRDDPFDGEPVGALMGMNDPPAAIPSAPPAPEEPRPSVHAPAGPDVDPHDESYRPPWA
ncbi:type VII secretion-associated serine protease mycosin [Actinocorallia populi]|uniref:type VII secretion-associated serine protease mycosin n=1 Tax=Actinocorallia populi TaxID=2079200 RepID=UPI0013009382|nr:type VII secretion-associated serine protease mycosin [Actinocorallia populi]